MIVFLDSFSHRFRYSSASATTILLLSHALQIRGSARFFFFALLFGPLFDPATAKYRYNAVRERGGVQLVRRSSLTILAQAQRSPKRRNFRSALSTNWIYWTRVFSSAFPFGSFFIFILDFVPSSSRSLGFGRVTFERTCARRQFKLGPIPNVTNSLRGALNGCLCMVREKFEFEVGFWLLVFYFSLFFRWEIFDSVQPTGSKGRLFLDKVLKKRKTRSTDGSVLSNHCVTALRFIS